MKSIPSLTIGALALVQPALACLNYNFSVEPGNYCLTAYFNDDNQQICQGRVCINRGGFENEWEIPCPAGYRLRIDAVGGVLGADWHIWYNTPHGSWDWDQRGQVGGPPYRASGSHFC